MSQNPCIYEHKTEEDDLACEMQSVAINKRKGRGAVTSGLTHECGVFGAIGCGEWPTQLEIAQIICWGLVALQHRYDFCYRQFYFFIIYEFFMLVPFYN